MVFLIAKTVCAEASYAVCVALGRCTPHQRVVWKRGQYLSLSMRGRVALFIESSIRRLDRRLWRGNLLWAQRRSWHLPSVNACDFDDFAF